MRSETDLLYKRINERFVKAFATYRLLEGDDHVLVGLSGGKDSLLLTELLARRARIFHPRFTVQALHVRMENIDYESSTDYLQQFCEDLGVRFHLSTTRFEQGKQPCFMCSWQRRKQLFNLAQQLGCNKIALGHHQDDLLHTCLMNLFFQGRFDTMPALLKMRKMPLSIIRPLCLVAEDDIRRYAELRGYEHQLKTCPYEHASRRTDMSRLFQQVQKMNTEARNSLWNAIERSSKLVQEDENAPAMIIKNT